MCVGLVNADEQHKPNLIAKGAAQSWRSFLLGAPARPWMITAHSSSRRGGVPCEPNRHRRRVAYSVRLNPKAMAADDQYAAMMIVFEALATACQVGALANMTESSLKVVAVEALLRAGYGVIEGTSRAGFGKLL